MNLFNFATALKKLQNDNRIRLKYTFFDEYDVIISEKKKFFKVYIQQMKGGNVFGPRNLSCFIDKNTGDIFKPASFNTPAKHKRGNVLSDQNGMEAFTLDGFVRYLK